GSLLAAVPVIAEAADDQWIQVPAFRMPMSIFASDAANRAYIAQHVTRDRPLDISNGIGSQRRSYDELWIKPWLERAQSLYPAKVERTTIGGVAVAIATPKDGVPARNRDRVLINLHGGGFTIGGGGGGGLVEAIPIAHQLGIEVVAVDYRMG